MIEHEKLSMEEKQLPRVERRRLQRERALEERKKNGNYPEPIKINMADIITAEDKKKEEKRSLKRKKEKEGV